MQRQLEDRMKFFEAKIGSQLNDLDRSHGNLKNEINNFFNLDEVNFSVIGKGKNREESEMFDLHNLNTQISGSIIQKKPLIPQKQKTEGFMDGGSSVKKPFMPEVHQSINPPSQQIQVKKLDVSDGSLMKVNKKDLQESGLDLANHSNSVVEYFVDEQGYLVD